MNKYLWILALFLVINRFFQLTTFLFPTLPADKVLSIQLWINALLIFSTFLPNTVASFLPSI